jgi:hypothetical protein
LQIFRPDPLPLQFLDICSKRSGSPALAFDKMKLERLADSPVSRGNPAEHPCGGIGCCGDFGSRPEVWALLLNACSACTDTGKLSKAAPRIC